MRISRESMFMEIARTVSKRSTCYRNNVGAVAVCENRVVSIGYNGAPPGQEHCLGNDCPLSEDGGCVKSLHAEQNALNFLDCDKFHFMTVDLYVTHSPCMNCAKKIVMGPTKVNKVIYEQEYRIADAIEFLIGQGIEVYRYTPAGFLINKEDNRITT